VKVVRYFVVGAASATVDFMLFAVLLFIFGKAAWFVAALASFIVATAFNYLLSIRLVFSTGVRFTKRQEIILVFLVSLVGLALNQAALWLLYQIAGWNIWIAKCTATATAFLWNFTARNSFIFRGSE